MSTESNLKGFSMPLSPEGKSQVVGGLPWNFCVDIMAINFRADANEIKKLIPEPLEPSREQPDGAYVWFGDWQALWAGWDNMLAINPERVLYKECLIGVRCSYKGVEGQRAVYVWVSDDFTMMRGWFMGFPKKIGEVSLGTTNRHLHELNPALGKVGPGSKYAAWCESHGERLVTAGIELKRKISPEKLPHPFGIDLFHTIHFPSVDLESKKPLIHQLTVLKSSNAKFGDVWEAEGSLTFHESELEEHTAIKPKEIVGAYLVPAGWRIEGTKLIHNYL